MKRPCLEDIQLAAEWLRCNEGDDGESEACSRVATWLDNYALDQEVRAAARQAGCTVAYFKKHMAARAEHSPLQREGSGS
jgi:hypothetical protein